MNTKVRCHYVGQLGWLSPEHLRDCKAADCRGCKPCGKTHCAMRGRCPEHVEPAAGIRTCPKCIGRTRADLSAIESLYALADVAVEHRHADYGALLDEASESGADGEAFNLVGPAADPGQWAERRRRLVARYDAAGVCDWPRHEALAPDDPHHPYAVLGRWDYALRESYGPSTDLFITVSRAADYLRGLLAGPFPHGDEFEDFAAEIAMCRTHLEAVVHDSRTPEEGRHCPWCIDQRGKGPRMQKRYAVHPGLPPGEKCGAKDGSQGEILPCSTCDGRDDTWHCPDVPSHWCSERDYRNRVAVDYVEHAAELPAAELAERLGVPLSTVRKWAARIWDKEAKAYTEPLLKSRRRGADGRKLYQVAEALRLAERRSA